ncbi:MULTISPECIES: hypothetical protein [Ralstonia]|uniref:hypothetical protein n=1 Tax=Ralstonia TaxID=48736 RepID=UPI002090F809|nr:hypothetical protein [Ralstonia mojiangensis]MCO5414024.1 hypothetical protein [Ralstonia mojiangensis]MCT7329024.1 hypothetical protein [Ralstonia mojiangensis]
MRTRFLTAALTSVIFGLGIGTTVAQTTTAPVDNQESSNPTKAPGKRTDPPSSTADRTANTSMPGSQATPAAGNDSDTNKPMHKKHRHHKKSKSDATVPGGTNSAGDMSHSGVQAGGNDAATTTGNSYPGSSKQGQ